MTVQQHPIISSLIVTNELITFHQNEYESLKKKQNMPNIKNSSAIGSLNKISSSLHRPNAELKDLF